MNNRTTRSSATRPSRSTVKALAVVLALTWLPAIHPWPVLAQEVISCSLNGFCLSNGVSNLLGLPNGTLKIVGFQPWDVVVKGTAQTAWAPLEAEARASLAGLHGVANDNRLPHTALNELRVLMFMRLLSIAQKRSQGMPITGVEQDALDMLRQLVAQSRTTAAQKAIDQYHGWQADPCHYTVPAGFGFDQYEPGPQCGVGGVMVAGPPRPPTKEQFTAYGGALAMKEQEAQIKEAKRVALGFSASDPAFVYDTSADLQAAFRDTDKALAIEIGVLGAVAAGSVAGIAALASTTVASTFAAMAGSFAIFGTAPSTVAVGAAASAGAIGVGVAAALPAIIIAATVIAVVFTIQFFEDQSVLPMLQESLDRSKELPDVWAVAGSDTGRVELFSVFMYQTLPGYDAERLAQVTPTPPTQRQPGDPEFEVNGQTTDVIETKAPDGKLQQTFMSRGWFVTRTQSAAGLWGPWQWNLTLQYRGALLSDAGTHTVGIQPSGFFHTYRSQALAIQNATKVTQFDALNALFQPQTIKWSGNQAPRLSPTVSATPVINSFVTFTAGASDPDGDSIVAVKWFFESPTRNVPKPSFDQCTIDPALVIDPVSGVALECPWVPADDVGTGVGTTYAHPGTWRVMVMAKDDEGAISSEQFTVSVGNLAPTLVMTQMPTPDSAGGIPEGQTVQVMGTLNYPSLDDGTYGALTKLVIEWGDGQVTQRMYPCTADLNVPSDLACVVSTTGTHAAFPGQTLPAGPWSFGFTHKYAYGSAGSSISNPSQIKVYAVTTLGAWSQFERVNFTATNVAPTLELRPTCSLVPAADGACVGDVREVPVGQPLTINARIYDILEANHFVKVIWGDGTSSALAPGCTDAECPNFVGWPGSTPPFFGLFPKYIRLSHTYQSVGTYPITILVDDGGPNGKVPQSASALIFGVSDLGGPTDVSSASPATFSYTSVAPSGATPTVTPTCEGGSVSSQTSTSFTCTFDDVATKTVRKARLRAVISGTTFDRSLDVNVTTRPTVVSAITGPPTATAGTTETYTYTASYSTLQLVFVQPTCGSNADAIASAEGSITCKFRDVDTQVTTDVGITISALGGSASSTLAVTVMPDVTPPVLTLPGPITVSSTSNAGANVTFTVAAADAVSGPSQFICSAFSGQLFPIGSTSVSCSASDWTGNVATGSFAVAVVDATPPTLTLSGSQKLDATSPSGAVTTFTAAASDAAPLAPPVTCVPASGSTFAVGTTNVVCSATDAAGNTASGTVAITVVGAEDQIAALERWVEQLPIEAQLQKQLLSALKKGEAAAVSGDQQAACKELAKVVSIVNKAGTRLTKAQVNKILNDVDRIRAVLAC